MPALHDPPLFSISSLLVILSCHRFVLPRAVLSSQGLSRSLLRKGIRLGIPSTFPPLEDEETPPPALLSAPSSVQFFFFRPAQKFFHGCEDIRLALYVSFLILPLGPGISKRFFPSRPHRRGSRRDSFFFSGSLCRVPLHLRPKRCRAFALPFAAGSSQGGAWAVHRAAIADLPACGPFFVSSFFLPQCARL